MFAVWHLSDDLNEDDANGGGNLENLEGDGKDDDGEKPAGKSLIYFQVKLTIQRITSVLSEQQEIATASGFFCAAMTEKLSCKCH